MKFTNYLNGNSVFKVLSINEPPFQNDIHIRENNLIVISTDQMNKII